MSARALDVGAVREHGAVIVVVGEHGDAAGREAETRVSRMARTLLMQPRACLASSVRERHCQRGTRRPAEARAGCMTARGASRAEIAGGGPSLCRAAGCSGAAPQQFAKSFPVWVAINSCDPI
jgi:hypothetical protein